jgi:hypothetical protein
MRRVGVGLGLIAVTVVAAGCASVGHTWQDEFTARLEGASGALEEALPEARSGSIGASYLRTFYELGYTLEFKGELIEKLDPPEGCEAVQEKGERAVDGLASFTYDVPKNLTPTLQKNLPGLIEERVAELEELEGEAETCATG